MASPKDKLLQAPFMQGGIPTDDDLLNFLAAVAPEHTTRVPLYKASPNSLYNVVRDILNDPEKADTTRAAIGEEAFNALKYRAPYRMGDRRQPETFGQPMGKPREVKQ